ncbi:putative short-chain dehydrogenase [Aaosphaeria arxii CBS 175.79]|uniref:Putative short-chain dehydrogenase n=1 Tax=Aaosphaeria arxii CBS 175.79 TaxID=1450172 RepID=A0A6A5XNX6_9PLEO|nr:putative short-chain dehydrogenase [Aaosphaeria arxii CBS 175.79]KAF2014430.1 putative short-chain dehydrogenase [Aaosphaeria arxii CBS 175.79]
MPPRVAVVVGCGGMGLAIARRLGVGRQLFLADHATDLLNTARDTLIDEGYAVTATLLDVSDFTSVCALAQAAAATGIVEVVVHTAGLSPTAASSRRIYEVNLLGTANIIEGFLPVATLGTSLVCVSSMAGYMVPALSPGLERHLATAARGELLTHQEISVDADDPSGPGQAYGLSKRGNLLRVQAAAHAWGKQGARVNSVSPGVISTGTGRNEIAAAAGKFIASSPAGRVGTPQDIVNAVSFLSSAEASFITGTDLLVDGGVVSSLRWKDANQV